MHAPSSTHAVVSRRALLLGAGAAAALAACSSGEDAGSTTQPTTAPTDAPEQTATDPTAAAPDPTTNEPEPEPSETEAEGETASASIDPLTAADFAVVAACGLSRGSGPGPFPTTTQLQRQDVTEGYPGHPVRLGFRVLDTDCQPIEGADLEIWQTDASGDYSEYTDDGDGKDEGEGSTFLRGFQTSDADGILEFQTIFPGWYPGRPPHIHVRVRTNGNIAHTGQFFFTDALSEAVYSGGAYEAFGITFTRNTEDQLGREATDDNAIATTADAPTALGPGTLALMNIQIAS